MLFRRLLNYLTDPIASDPNVGDVPIFDGSRFVAGPQTGGGGGLPSWIQTGDGEPNGVVTPEQIGALYIDFTNGGAYIAIGLTSADWWQIGGSYGAGYNVGVETDGDDLLLVGPDGAKARMVTRDQHDFAEVDDSGDAPVFTIQMNGITWQFGTVNGFDGALLMPNGSSLFGEDNPPNSFGNNGDWSFTFDGHILFKAAGAWVTKV